MIFCEFNSPLSEQIAYRMTIYRITLRNILEQVYTNNLLDLFKLFNNVLETLVDSFVRERTVCEQVVLKNLLSWVPGICLENERMVENRFHKHEKKKRIVTCATELILYYKFWQLAERCPLHSPLYYTISKPSIENPVCSRRRWKTFWALSGTSTRLYKQASIIETWNPWTIGHNLPIKESQAVKALWELLVGAFDPEDSSCQWPLYSFCIHK